MRILKSQKLVIGLSKAFTNGRAISYEGHAHSTSQITGLNTELLNLKTSVSNGKSMVAAAVTDKGVQTAADATFNTIANNIRNIKTASVQSSALLFETFVRDYSLGWNTGKAAINFNVELNAILCKVGGYGIFFILVQDVNNVYSFTYPNGNDVFDAKLTYSSGKYKINLRCTSNFGFDLYATYI